VTGGSLDEMAMSCETHLVACGKIQEKYL